MLVRCYSAASQVNNPTYVGCSVCEEWLTFSNFKCWMETQDHEGNQLDKDLLFQGNKVYSPETCIFVSPQVNSFLTECTVSRGKHPIGARLHNKSGKFLSQCSNPFTNKIEHLGSFNTAYEAHTAWLNRKLELAKELSVLQSNPVVGAALIERYSNYNSTTNGH